jgi:hypothetical protein
MPPNRSVGSSRCDLLDSNLYPCSEPTQADVRLALAQQDQEDLLENVELVQSDVSPSIMINMGLELEAQQ